MNILSGVILTISFSIFLIVSLIILSNPNPMGDNSTNKASESISKTDIKESIK